MNAAATVATLIALLAACGPDERLPPDVPRADASRVDAGHDAGRDAGIDALIVTCRGGEPLCPAAMPYCCGTLEDVPTCSATFVNGACNEHPIDGVPTACDTTTGSGCSGATPICCGIQGTATTYCTSHAYAGADWECSGG